MKNKIKIIIGSFFFAAIILFNLSVISNSESTVSINTNLEMIAITAQAESETPDGYFKCYSGDKDLNGQMVRYCGDCMAHYVWLKNDGYCRTY
jgi:hypothetical protein